MVQNTNAIYNTVGNTISGVTNTFSVTNQSNTASSAARETIVVGGGSAGDPTLNFNVSGVTNWEMGIDNSVADNLTISQGTALGTNDTWRMNVAGQRTLPLQSSFFAWQQNNVPNITGDATAYTIQFPTAATNINSNFNTATGLYTAPVNGFYMFQAGVITGNYTAAHNDGKLAFGKNGTTQIGACIRANFYQMAINGPGGNIALSISLAIALNAGDTVQAFLQVGSGTKTIGIIIPGPEMLNFFSGCLLH